MLVKYFILFEDLCNKHKGDEAIYERVLKIENKVSRAWSHKNIQKSISYHLLLGCVCGPQV